MTERSCDTTVWLMCFVLLSCLQLPPLPSRNHMHTVDWIDELNEGKVIPAGESAVLADVLGFRTLAVLTFVDL